MVVGGRPQGPNLPVTPMHRLRAEVLPEGAGEVAIGDVEAHHLRVRRAEHGDAVTIIDGAGGVATGSLHLAGREWIARIATVERVAPPGFFTLLVGSGDKDRFGWLVEKAVEVGVSRIVAVSTERSRTVASRVRDQHLERLQRRADEALKQCGGLWAMQVDPAVVPLEAALGLGAPGERWLADAAGGPPTPLSLGRGAVLIGPEGGLTEGERNLALGQGFAPVRLGPLTLRFETAAIAAGLVARLSAEEPR